MVRIAGRGVEADPRRVRRHVAVSAAVAEIYPLKIRGAAMSSALVTRPPVGQRGPCTAITGTPGFLAG
jgi:hypothetical protein